MQLFYTCCPFLFTQSFSPGRSIKYEIKELENFIHSKHKEFNTLVADTSLIKRLAFNTYSEKELEEFTSSKYSTGIFVYKKDFGGGELKFWNNQISFPPNEIFSYPDTAYFEQRPNGFYICLKNTFGLAAKHDSIATIGMIPVMYRYFSSLPDEFAYSKTASSRISISGLPTEYPVTGLSGQYPFLYFPGNKQNLCYAKPEYHLQITSGIVIIDLYSFYRRENFTRIWFLERTIIFDRYSYFLKIIELFFPISFQLSPI